VKGRGEFTPEEAELIRNLLREKVVADRDSQKKIREKLRNLGFHIADWSTSPEGFGAIDFDVLVNTGQIQVGGGLSSPSIRVNLTSLNQTGHASNVQPTENPERAERPSGQVVARELETAPWSVRRVKSNRSSGIPSLPGLYAWWQTKGSIPEVPHVPHSEDEELGLLYVGISPSSSSSAQTLQGRVYGNHLSGNVGSSTFRLTLAALLRVELGLTPRSHGTKIVLPADQNPALSAWQDEHLAVSWVVRPDPWEVESDVIAWMAPPLNLAGNREHSFYSVVTEARRALRASAD
jgi:hypothetical protein